MWNSSPGLWHPILHMFPLRRCLVEGGWARHQLSLPCVPAMAESQCWQMPNGHIITRWMRAPLFCFLRPFLALSQTMYSLSGFPPELYLVWLWRENERCISVQRHKLNSIVLPGFLHETEPETKAYVWVVHGSGVWYKAHKAGIDVRLTQKHAPPGLLNCHWWSVQPQSSKNIMKCISELSSVGIGVSHHLTSPSICIVQVETQFGPLSSFCATASGRPQGKYDGVCTGVRLHLQEALGIFREAVLKDHEMYARSVQFKYDSVLTQQ